MNSISDEILKAIKYAVDRKTVNCDRTYKSVIKSVKPNGKGYVVLDDSGAERTVRCCIPGFELKIGQQVWVKVPCGQLKDIHVVGVV